MSTDNNTIGGVAGAGAAPGLALRDACLREIEHAEAILGSASSRPHRAIHHARKAMRRIRTGLALANMDSDEATAVDRSLKRLAKTLSRVRDAAVAVETYDRTVKHAALREIVESLEPLRASLIRQRDEALSAHLLRDPGFELVRSRLRDLHGRMLLLPWSDIHVGAIARAMRKATRRAEKSAAEAKKRFEENVRHCWRRRLRRLNDQHVLIEGLISGAWPENASGRQKLIARLRRIESKHLLDWPRVAGVISVSVQFDAVRTKQLLRPLSG